MHLVLRHQNLYPYINAGTDFSGKANPFQARFNSHLIGWTGRIRTCEIQHPKCCVLPLDDSPIYWRSCQFNLRQSKSNYFCALRDVNWVKQILTFDL